jgi:hypothetical protein
MEEHRTANPQDRQARALEYIAHYLELIEGHLEQLASSERTGALQQLQKAIMMLIPALGHSKK